MLNSKVRRDLFLFLIYNPGLSIWLRHKVSHFWKKTKVKLYYLILWFRDSHFHVLSLIRKSNFNPIFPSSIRDHCMHWYGIFSDIFSPFHLFNLSYLLHISSLFWGQITVPTVECLNQQLKL